MNRKSFDSTSGTEDTKRRILLNVNGKEYGVTVGDNALLIDVLRDEFGLTGVKWGCGIGECGACTVLIDGKPVLSCMMLAVEVQGRKILTIEGLEEDGKLHSLQQAFIDYDGVQCGYCTPGMILSAKALVDNNPNPTERDVQEALSGNLCRCGVYPNAVRAILAAAENMRKRVI